ncbi:uncharacterized protein N7483_011553 [Penicillium malachiteum]|uniref:uncharacterized protein n=1 Tax=Penicillium malachiteum TaxID=1324776 RepID=UPI002548168C|nr:uncharacterized protein N7483_011553 [Penicillium malachiteum]KAJ5714372.1 hypothetical protein N7483_011553 [Penicillium malachiteum]
MSSNTSHQDASHVHPEGTSAHGENLVIPESLLPRPDSPLAQGPFTHVPRPLHTDMLLPSTLEPRYLEVVNDINGATLESNHRSLMWAIHRLSGLHVANDNCVVVNACLERLCHDGLVQRMVLYEQIFMHLPMTHDQDSDIRGLLDMCLFLHYVPLVKRDINGLPDGPQKDILKRLFLAICPGGHTVE